MPAANRGKYAEGKVKVWLRALEQAQPSWHLRLPDPHAGSMVATTGDFLWVYRGNVAIIEVKEVAHATRLPHKNFKPEQVARLKAAQIAGVHPLVLIYFTPTKLWRCVPLTEFETREGGSWYFHPELGLDFKTLTKQLETFPSCHWL